MHKTRLAAATLSAALLLDSAAALAVITTYSRTAGFTAFNTVTGGSPVAIDFDDIPFGTEIAGSTLRGATFASQAGGAPLLVVRAADTFTPAVGFTSSPNPAANVLPATSGANVLSPGGITLGPGPNPLVERDGLTLTFAIPLSAFGFDHLSQSADGFSFTAVAVRNAANQSLYSNTIPISNLAGQPAGADFWGVFSTNADIKSITFTENDADSTNPDCNIGYDSIRLSIGGDANYDWVIDADDFARIDRGDAMNLSGWSNGDFNNDNTVNAADYLIIDRAFALQQGALSPALLADRAAQFGPAYVASLLSSVPEPATPLAPLAALSMLRRRPRPNLPA